MKSWPFPLFIFAINTLLGQSPTQIRPPHGPNAYDLHPYETHPYNLQTYEPHLPYTPAEIAELKQRQGTDDQLPTADQEPLLSPDEIQRQRRGSAYSQANAQAMHVLVLIDQQAYGGAWLESGGLLRDVVTRHQWAAALKASRNGLGQVTSRKVSTHNVIQTLPYGSRGNFMIIKYRTGFSQKPGLVETVTLAAEGPLQLWKVIAYKIDKR